MLNLINSIREHILVIYNNMIKILKNVQGAQTVSVDTKDLTLNSNVWCCVPQSKHDDVQIRYRTIQQVPYYFIISTVHVNMTLNSAFNLQVLTITHIST